jgi:hypothetical protein
MTGSLGPPSPRGARPFLGWLTLGSVFVMALLAAGLAQTSPPTRAASPAPTYEIALDPSAGIQVGDIVQVAITMTPADAPGTTTFSVYAGGFTTDRFTVNLTNGTATFSWTATRADSIKVCFAPSSSNWDSGCEQVSVTIRKHNPGPLSVSAPASVTQSHPLTVFYTMPDGRSDAGLTFYFRRTGGSNLVFDCSQDFDTQTGADVCSGDAPGAAGSYVVWASIPLDATYEALTSEQVSLEVKRDRAVEVGGLKASASKFYPVKDGYRDTVTMRLRPLEPLTMNARVVNSRGKTVRRFSRVDGARSGSWTWNGRSSGGRLVSPGVYSFIVHASDRAGNDVAKSAKVTISSEMLVWKTRRLTVHASEYSFADNAVDGSVRASASRYSGGAVVDGGSTMNAYARAFYRIKLPDGALRFKSFFFCAQGVARHGQNPAFVGLSDFDAQSITWVQVPSDPTRCWGIKISTSDGIGGYVRKGVIEGSIVASGYYDMSYDSRQVRVEIRYAVLGHSHAGAANAEVGHDVVTSGRVAPRADLPKAAKRILRDQRRLAPFE